MQIQKCPEIWFLKRMFDCRCFSKCITHITHCIVRQTYQPIFMLWDLNTINTSSTFHTIFQEKKVHMGSWIQLDHTIPYQMMPYLPALVSCAVEGKILPDPTVHLVQGHLSPAIDRQCYYVNILNNKDLSLSSWTKWEIWTTHSENVINMFIILYAYLVEAIARHISAAYE